MRCLSPLYDRDCRRSFCNPSLWLAPAVRRPPPVSAAAGAARLHEAAAEPDGEAREPGSGSGLLGDSTWGGLGWLLEGGSERGVRGGGINAMAGAGGGGGEGGGWVSRQREQQEQQDASAMARVLRTVPHVITFEQR